MKNCIIYKNIGAISVIDNELTECIIDDKMTEKQIAKMCKEITAHEKASDEPRFDIVYPYYY